MIKPILKKYNAEGAMLFGSYARNEATASSDIDLLVNGGKSFDATDILCIADELYEASGKQVDVYEKSEITKESDFFIFQSGQETDNGAEIDKLQFIGEFTKQ